MSSQEELEGFDSSPVEESGGEEIETSNEPTFQFSDDSQSQEVVQEEKPKKKKPEKGLQKKPKKEVQKKDKKSSVTKKAAPKKEKEPIEWGMERSYDIPWNAKKVSIFKALKALRALDPMSARTAKEIAEKSGLDPMTVRHYCYHAKAGGLVNISQMEGVRGFSFSLTAKGAKIDPDLELKKATK